MAYLKPKQTIFISNNGLPIYSLVEKVAFRRYRGKYTDRREENQVEVYALCCM